MHVSQPISGSANARSENGKVTDVTEIPIVRNESDVKAYAGAVADVEGIYQQEDVRMMQVDPPVLFRGHVVVVLEDGCKVFLYAPASPDALRSQAEIQAHEHKKVRVRGLLYPTIPQPGAIQVAPCLVDVQSIELIS
jgi:hypothetical protein